MPKLSYHLRWNNHLQNLQNLFENLYSEQSLVDVTLSCSDGLLYAHKIVLSACSRYFEQLFKSNPCKHPILILRGIKQHDMQTLLQYMYAGSVDVVEEDLEMLLSIATELQIKGLMHSDPLYQTMNNEKSNTCSEDPQNQIDSSLPQLQQLDHLKWQAELVAQPARSKSRDQRSEQYSDSSHDLQNEIHIRNIKSEPVEEHSGVEIYPTHNEEEQIVTKKETVDECNTEDNSMDFTRVHDTTEKQNESLEATPNPSANKPVENDDLDCYCQVCNRTFQNKVSYHRHMLTHTGIKPHRCTFCSHSFLRLSHLQRHIRVHTGERPYSCVKCPKRFARSDKLRQHYIFQHSDSKICKVTKPRGRPRKHGELYGPSPTGYETPPLINANTFPPLSIIPIPSNPV